MRWSARRLLATGRRAIALGEGGRDGGALPLQSALDSLPQGFTVFDRRQKLVFCNRVYAEIYGLPPELTVPGTALRAILEHRIAQGIFSGSDPASYLENVIALTANGEPSTDEHTLPDGRLIFISHRPLTDGGWISTHEDITARRSAERQNQQRIQAQNEHLDAAIGNMSHGLAMFDRRQRLIVCNRLYAEFYRLPPHLVRPGTPLKAILEDRIGRGYFSGRDPQADLHRILSTVTVNRPTTNEFTLPDGRTLLVSHRPLADGGWVAMFEDVTVRKRAEQELERTRKFLDTVIDHVPVAILVRDPGTLRYMLINRAAEQFVGWSRDKVLGKTAHDIFPRERADLIAAHDAEALRDPNKPLLISDHAIQIPGGPDRMVTTKKLTVQGDDGKPLCLIAVIEDVTEKRLAEEQIAFLAHHDALTGLPNRAQFGKQLQEALGRGSQLAVLFLDLDHFKTVNDTLGHFIGDELLKAVADRLRQCVRAVDLIGRMGGDEFAVVQTAIAGPAEVSALAMAIQEAIKAPYDLSGIQTVVDVSIGIALAPTDAADATELMKRADMALYRAKADGRSRYRFFEPAMDAAMKARRRLDTELRAALANDEFVLVYQPVVDLARNSVVGMEGLLRWRHPAAGLISPADFVPVAEENGLIIPIGEWVIRQACADAARWPEHIRLALNLSPVQFRSANLGLVVAGALLRSGIAAGRLELEVTEDVLLERNAENLAILEQLRGLGVRIVMDDFGTGYSSLNYLRSFRFDKLKIDRSFVKDLAGGDAQSRAIVRAVVSLAAALNVPTTAEGIETREQLEFVRAAGCTEYQGYFFSAPKPAEEILRMFEAGTGRATSAA